MTPYVTPELLQKMVPARDRIRAVEEEKQSNAVSGNQMGVQRISISSPSGLILQRKAKSEQNNPVEAVPGSGKGKEPAATPMEIDGGSSSNKTEQDIMKEIGLDESLSTDVGACVHGQYELVAVITHLGRTADGGHYIAWVKKGADEWRK